MNMKETKYLCSLYLEDEVNKLTFIASKEYTGNYTSEQLIDITINDLFDERFRQASCKPQVLIERIDCEN
jgi:hypothetical protein